MHVDNCMHRNDQLEISYLTILQLPTRGFHFVNKDSRRLQSLSVYPLNGSLNMARFGRATAAQSTLKKQQNNIQYKIYTTNSVDIYICSIIGALDIHFNLTPVSTADNTSYCVHYLNETVSTISDSLPAKAL